MEKLRVDFTGGRKMQSPSSPAEGGGGEKGRKWGKKRHRGKRKEKVEGIEEKTCWQ